MERILNPSRKQLLSLANSNSRLNIWDGSVRSGKTWISILRWIRYIATAPKGDLLMIGYTAGTLYRNIILPMQEMIGDDMVFLSSAQRVKLWGRLIHCVYAKDDRAESIIRGMTCAGAYGDELTLWSEKVFKQMLARLSVKDAKFFGTTNPDSPHHWLKTEVIDNDVMDLSYFHFKLTDNTWLMEDNPEYVKQIMQEYTGLWYLRFIEGIWAIAQGIIYDGYNESVHLYEESDPIVQRSVSCDYGTQNACVFLLFGESWHSVTREKSYWLEDEYYYSGRDQRLQKTDEQYCDEMDKFLDGRKVDCIYVDPSAASFIAALRQRGYYVIAADNSVDDGLRLQSRMLKSGRYKIHKRCFWTRKEYTLYSWNEKKSEKTGVDEPIKLNDHTKDAERYYFSTRIGFKTTYNYSDMMKKAVK